MDFNGKRVIADMLGAGFVQETTFQYDVTVPNELIGSNLYVIHGNTIGLHHVNHTIISCEIGRHIALFNCSQTRPKKFLL